GLAGRLFEHVLEQTLVAQGRWATMLGFRPAVSVNLSPYQLQDPLLPASVALALTRASAPADGLWLEITESAIADAGATSTLHELRDLGVRLAIDDFGTGWSSLARLSEFPCDLLKIDRSFISPLAPGNHAEHLVRATIQMAHALGIPTVAEGIETEEQLALLTHLGCDIGQGYLFAKPLTAPLAIDEVAPDGRWTGPGRVGHLAPPPPVTG
ncbi:MAG: EAL domain-containing protein, partial [Egicoccus sp.]